jgi:glycosyltransferase involved in cell wall biosynthesis
MKAERQRTKINFLVHDLSTNPIVRAAPLIRAAQRQYEVDVVGIRSNEIYEPFRDAFQFRTIQVAGIVAQAAAAPLLARLLDGDLLIACKPLPTTLLPALLRRRSRPIILDVEDDESASPGRLHGFLARLTEPLARRADAITVGSRVLQGRFGGTLVRHGPDESVFDGSYHGPAHRAEMRSKFNLPRDRRLALFAGVPRRHKGWHVLVDALRRPETAGWDLVVAGGLGDDLHNMASAELGARFHKLPVVPNGIMPQLLAAVDAVPVPQLPETYASAQVPAKALEAMAASIPLIATRVGDLPEIIGADRGWLIEPENPAALAEALRDIGNNPSEAQRRGRLARAWFLKEASATTLAERLLPIVEQLLQRRPRS